MKKIKKTAPSEVGIGFGNVSAVQIKLTRKDFLLIAGIIVALILALSTWLAGGSVLTENNPVIPQLNVSPTASLMHELSKGIVQIGTLVSNVW